MYNRKIPGYARWISLFFFRNEKWETILCDLEEGYQIILNEDGSIRARMWYLTQVINIIRGRLLNKLYWSGLMIRNYFKTAFRNIAKNKGYSLINIAGFTIGLSSCIFIWLYIRYELSYDQYHNDAPFIYRVVREHRGGPVWYNSSEHPLAASLKADFPEVVNATRVKKNDEIGVVEYQSKRFNEEDLYFVDQDFLDIFTFSFISGNKHTALKEPFSVLITQSMAEKYFGTEDPMGKILRIKEWYGLRKYDYTIKGVLKNVPENSHFKFDFLISYNTLYILKRGGRASVETWDYFEPKTYIRLSRQTIPIHLEEKFPEFLIKYKGNASVPTKEKMHLQSLTDIHLGGNLRYELEANSDMKVIYLFSAIAFLIIFIASLNYVNLSVAQSTKRAIEVGIRKVVGAQKSHLVIQFIGESMVFSLLALLISLFLVHLLLPVFGSLIERNLTLNFAQALKYHLLFLCFTIVIGFLSGCYPAFFVSTFRPIKIIKGTLKICSKNLTAFRNALVIVQFIMSIVLIICTFVINKQLGYMKNKNLGFDREQIITIYTMDRNLTRNPDLLKTELLKNPNILRVSVSLDLPTTIHRAVGAEWEAGGESRDSEFNYSFIDGDFLHVYDMTLVKGRNFSKDYSLDEGRTVIINETAMRNIGWEDPVGRSFHCMSNDWTVIGVVKDFHFRSLHSKIEPMIFVFHQNRGIDYFSVKINPQDISSTIEFIEEKWRQYSPEFPFQYTFLNDRIDNIYSAEEKFGTSFQVFTTIAISIACMGLMGLASFVSEQRKKEVSIRKVLGADSRSILVLLARVFIKCIVVAAVIACPIAYFLMNRWLENFVYRTTLGIEIFILSGLMALIITLVTIGYQLLKTAVANPVDALKYE